MRKTRIRNQQVPEIYPLMSNDYDIFLITISLFRWRRGETVKEDEQVNLREPLEPSTPVTAVAETKKGHYIANGITRLVITFKMKIESNLYISPLYQFVGSYRVFKRCITL